MDKKKAAIVGAAAVIGAVSAGVTAKKVYDCVTGSCGDNPCENGSSCDGDCSCGQCGEPEDGVEAPDVGADSGALFTPTPVTPD